MLPRASSDCSRAAVAEEDVDDLIVLKIDVSVLLFYQHLALLHLSYRSERFGTHKMGTRVHTFRLDTDQMLSSTNRYRFFSVQKNFASQTKSITIEAYLRALSCNQSRLS